MARLLSANSLAFLLLHVTDGFRTAATSKMELFVIIANGFQPLTIITKCSILDGAAVLDPPLYIEIRIYDGDKNFLLAILNLR